MRYLGVMMLLFVVACGKMDTLEETVYEVKSSVPIQKGLVGAS